MFIKILQLFILINICFFKFNKANINPICNTINLEIQKIQNNIINNELEFIKELYTWCLTDIGCKHLYAQEPRANFTLFKILLEHNLEKPNRKKTKIIQNLLCQKENTNDIIKDLWILEMKNLISNVRPAIYCDVNHRLSFNAETLTYSCVCIEDRVCSDRLYPLTFYYVFLISLIILAIGFFTLNTYRMFIQIITLNKLTKSKEKDMIKILNDLLI